MRSILILLATILIGCSSLFAMCALAKSPDIAEVMKGLGFSEESDGYWEKGQKKTANGSYAAVSITEYNTAAEALRMFQTMTLNFKATYIGYEELDLGLEQRGLVGTHEFAHSGRQYSSAEGYEPVSGDAKGHMRRNRHYITVVYTCYGRQCEKQSPAPPDVREKVAKEADALASSARSEVKSILYQLAGRLPEPVDRIGEIAFEPAPVAAILAPPCVKVYAGGIPGTAKLIVAPTERQDAGPVKTHITNQSANDVTVRRAGAPASSPAGVLSYPLRISAGSAAPLGPMPVLIAVTQGGTRDEVTLWVGVARDKVFPHERPPIFVNAGPVGRPPRKEPVVEVDRVPAEPAVARDALTFPVATVDTETPDSGPALPKAAAVELARAIKLIGRDDHGAGAALLRAVDIAPDSGKLWARLGSFYIDTGNLAEAIKALTKATELEPQVMMHHAELAEALFQLGRRDEAVRAAKEAIRLGGTLDDHMIFEDLGLLK